MREAIKAGLMEMVELSTVTGRDWIWGYQWWPSSLPKKAVCPGKSGWIRRYDGQAEMNSEFWWDRASNSGPSWSHNILWICVPINSILLLLIWQRYLSVKGEICWITVSHLNSFFSCNNSSSAIWVTYDHSHQHKVGNDVAHLWSPTETQAVIALRWHLNPCPSKALFQTHTTVISRSQCSCKLHGTAQLQGGLRLPQYPRGYTVTAPQVGLKLRLSMARVPKLPCFKAITERSLLCSDLSGKVFLLAPFCLRTQHTIHSQYTARSLKNLPIFSSLLLTTEQGSLDLVIKCLLNKSSHIRILTDAFQSFLVFIELCK